MSKTIKSKAKNRKYFSRAIQLTKIFAKTSYKEPIWIIATVIFGAAISFLFTLGSLIEETTTVNKLIDGSQVALADVIAAADLSDKYAKGIDLYLGVLELDIAILEALSSSPSHSSSKVSIFELKARARNCREWLEPLLNEYKGTVYYSSDSQIWTDSSKVTTEGIEEMIESMDEVEKFADDLLSGSHDPKFPKFGDKTSRAKIQERTYKAASRNRATENLEHKYQTNLIELDARITYIKAKKIIAAIAVLYCAGFLISCLISIWKQKLT